MSNSTHDVVVVKLGPPEVHPNADRLEIHRIFDAYRCVSQKGLYKEGDLVAYIPPDNVVPDTEDFAWLEGKRRIKAKKLRGVISYGLLHPAPLGSVEGDVVTDHMGISHYEPEVHYTMNRGPEAPAPAGFYPKYDLDALLRYSRLLEPGEMVWVTEKIHGANCSVVYVDGELHVKSRNLWCVDTPDNMFWRAVRGTPNLVEWLEEHPGLTVVGEVVPCAKAGGVTFNYGNDWGAHTMLVFDIHQNGEYFSHELARGISQNLPWVPVIACEPFSIERMEELASGKSLVPGANHIREGIVLTPVNERSHATLGRIKLKLVSPAYLEL